MTPEPAAQKVSDEELIEAVQRECLTRGVPVVPTRQVAKAEGVNIQQQQVSRRLESLADDQRINSISVGRGAVYWVPEDGREAKGQVDFSFVDWDTINPDPEEIPEEILEEHPNFHDPSYWEEVEESANSTIGVAGLAAIAGVILLILVNIDLPFIEFSPELRAAGQVAVGGGFVFIAIGFGLLGLAKLGQRIEVRNVLPDSIEPLFQRGSDSEEDQTE